jgi:fructokinase
MGAQVSLVSRVGNDALGKNLIEELSRREITATTIQVDESFPTGTVSVFLSADGQPNYRLDEGVAWDHMSVTLAGTAAIRRADAVCFGTLAQRNEASRRAIQQLLGAASPSALRVLDLNLRDPYWSAEVVEQSLFLADVLKLNELELAALSAMWDLEGSRKDRIEALCGMFGLRSVVLTCGADGSLLWKNGEWSERGPEPLVRVVDTVGAGDAFTAATVMGLLKLLPLDQLHAKAAAVASYVVSCQGATPPLPRELCVWSLP